MIRSRNRNLALIVVLVLVAGLAPASGAAKAGRPFDIKGFDAFMAKAMADWKVPGTAVAIVKDGKIVLAKGYGLRDVANGLPVTSKTLFAIGSSSKAFTATSVGILVDEGKLDWDRRVREYLPTFELQDPVATAQMTPRDLLCHRSGLPRHDLAWIGAGLTRQELFDRMRYLEPRADFRAIFQYNNFMIMTAGYLAGKVAGSTWEDVVRTRILEPLGMADTNFSVEDSKKSPDHALPYGEKDGQVVAIPFRNIDPIGPAGSINSHAEDMARWVLMNLAKGKAGDRQVISERSLAEIHSPQMVVQEGAFRSLEAFPEMTTTTYGMGWFLTSYRGHPWVHHGGAINGFKAVVTFLPRDNAGVVVLCNKGGTDLPDIVSLNVYDRLLGLDQVSWSARIKEIRDRQRAEGLKRRAEGDKERKEGTKPSHPLGDYVGEYVHPAYGTIAVTGEGDGLRATRWDTTFVLTHYHYDVFELKNEDGGGGLKASFALDPKGNVASVSVPFAPGVKDIVFTRVPDRAAAKPAGPRS